MEEKKVELEWEVLRELLKLDEVCLMSEPLEELISGIYSFIQSKCLWQFFPREWDRKANIVGIMGMAAELVANSRLPQPETLVERYYYVEAKMLVSDIKKEFPQLFELGEAERREVIEKVKEKLLEVMVLKSINPELRLSSY